MISAYSPSMNRYEYSPTSRIKDSTTVDRAEAAPSAISTATITSAAVTPISRVTLVTQANPFEARQESVQFLNQYQHQMKGLSGAANKLRTLNKDSLWNTFSVNSSDEAAAEVYSSSKLTEKANYEVNVLQMAAEQISRTAAVNGSGKGAYTDGSMELSLVNSPEKKVSIDVKTTDAEGNARTNREVQADMVSQINKAGLGVKASIVEENNKSYIQIESETGTANSFKVDNGTGDPHAKFVTTQDAQNLKYTVSKDGTPLNGGMVFQNSSDDNVHIDGYKISASFKKTGSVDINVGVDTEKLTKAAEDFVNQYNNTLELLVDNAHRGTGTSKTLSNFQRAPISKDAMETIGITLEENGRLTLDGKKFGMVLEKEPGKVRDILSDNYSIADGVYQDVQRGLGESASKLISNDLEKEIYSQLHMQPISFDYGRYGIMSRMNNMSLYFSMMA